MSSCLENHPPTDPRQTGWITVSAWIFSVAGPPSIIANMITGMAIFSFPNYSPKRWHTTLIMWAFIIIPYIFNLWFRQLLNAFELIGGIGHIVFFIVSMVTLIVLGERSSTEYVFKTLTHGDGGWNNQGVAWGVGLLTITFSVTGERLPLATACRSSSLTNLP